MSNESIRADISRKPADKLIVFVYAECCARAGSVVLGIEDDVEAKKCSDYICFSGTRAEILAEMDERASWGDAYNRSVAKNVQEYLR